MNKRIKKKRWIAKLNNQTTVKQRIANRELCKRYPFLIPRSGFGKPIWDVRWDGKRDKPYSTTLAENFPSGWWEAFGIDLCEELRQDLIKCKYLYDFRMLEIKEKWGELRIYTCGLPEGSDTWDIIDDYSALSRNICISCGKPDVHIIDDGWIRPICCDCYLRQEKRLIGDELTAEEIKNIYQKSIVFEEHKMHDTRTIIRNEETITYDLTTKAERIRARWRSAEGGDD